MNQSKILQSQIYREFDKLPLEEKEIYVSFLQRNIDNQKLKDIEIKKNNRIKQINSTRSCERQSNYQQQANYQKSSIVPNKSEWRFFQMVEEEIQKFKNNSSILKQDYTLDYFDDSSFSIKKKQDYLAINDQQNQSSLEHTRWNENQSNISTNSKSSYYNKQNTNQMIKNYDMVKIGNKSRMRLSLFSIEILDDNEKTLIKKEPYKFLQQANTCVKFNQLFGQKEMDILNSGSRMLNSSIINAYVNYLMIQDEEKYFALPSSERKKYERLYIFNSEFITDCSIDRYDTNIPLDLKQKKHLYLWLKYLDNFKEISYRFDQIYKKIGFIVNVNNFHWYFAEVSLQKEEIIIYDSLFQFECYLSNLQQVLSYLFGQLLQVSDFILKLSMGNFQKQIEPLSCGYYTCIAANYLSQEEPSRNMYNLEEMKKILKEKLFTN